MGARDPEDKEEGTEPLGALRPENKARLCQKIETALSEPYVTSCVYQPDDRSNLMARKYVNAPLMQKSSRWQMHGAKETHEVQEQVALGIFPQGGCLLSQKLPNSISMGLKELWGTLRRTREEILTRFNSPSVAQHALRLHCPT